MTTSAHTAAEPVTPALVSRLPNVGTTIFLSLIHI